MKLIFFCFVYFLAFQLKGQGIKVIDFNSNYYKNDSIIIKLKNIDTINYYINIQLEKKMKKGWLLYTKDIFNPPFADILNSKFIPIDTIIKFIFILPEPEWFDDPTWSITYRKKIRAGIKIGKFRYKIFISSRNDNEYALFLYSPIFFVNKIRSSYN